MPQIDKGRRLSAAEFGRWVSAYNDAGIDLGCMPPQEAMEQARKCAFVVCSDFPRSSESARVLGFEDSDVCESMFREVGSPMPIGSFPGYRQECGLCFLGACGHLAIRRTRNHLKKQDKGRMDALSAWRGWHPNMAGCCNVIPGTAFKPAANLTLPKSTQCTTGGCFSSYPTQTFLIGCLSAFCLSFCLCFSLFCFWLFSLPFLPPLSPIFISPVNVVNEF